MTVPTWVSWLAMTILYFGAFHTAIRPGRWYGSRILPLAASVLATFAAAGLAYEFEGTLWPCLIVLVVDVWLIAMILFAARTRDYPDFNRDPIMTMRGEQFRYLALAILLAIGAGLIGDLQAAGACR